MIIHDEKPNYTNMAHKYNMGALRIQQHLKLSSYQKIPKFIEPITKQNRNILILAKPN